ASTTRRYGGTGLGLAISRQLIELMGGTLHVESRLGEGSTFWAEVRLPLATEAPAATQPIVDLSGSRVLIVDDNAVNRRVVREMIAAWRMRADEVESGEAALAALRAARRERDPYALAIVDFHMPGMDGEALGRSIKTDPSLARTALVLLSSVGLRGEGGRFREAGFAAALVKPVRASQLLDAVSEALVARSGAAPPTSPAPVREARPRPASGTQAIVLVVEDNPINQQVAVGMLSKLGCEVTVARSGVEALARLEERAYGVVFMDCEMPEMDGYEATAEIRRREGAGGHTPIVAMTAHAMDGDREKCLAAGMDDYVSKPLDAAALEAVLRRWEPARATPVPAPAGRAPAPVAVGDAPAVDGRRLAELRGILGGDGDLTAFAGVVEGFLADTRARLDALRAAGLTRDAAAVRQLAHALRGSLLNLGVPRMAALAAALEERGARGDVDDAPARLEGLEDEFARVRRALTPELEDARR
ncbi:MAG TPA: response regulator, partial [Methylomirabilota bacterium]|nr:response regulator [Methylomirabilota bacterium]